MVRARTGQDTIAVVGGYGHVGQKVARKLLSTRRWRVVLAGRSPAKAKRAADALGCDAAALDTTNPDTWSQSLSSADMVVICVDQPGTGLVEWILRRGKTYVDITADYSFLQKVEQFHELAAAHQARAILSVGFVPGLSNLLVKHGTGKLDLASEAEIGVLLGLGDAHGYAAILWVLQRAAAQAVTAPKMLSFGDGCRSYPGYPFDFSDQYTLPRTMRLGRVNTYLTFDYPALTRIAFALAPWLHGRPRLMSVVAKLMQHVRIGSDRAALCVHVRGKENGHSTTCLVAFEARREADITALVASYVVEQLMDNIGPGGVFHIDEIFDPEPLLQMLGERGGKYRCEMMRLDTEKSV